MIRIKHHGRFTFGMRMVDGIDTPISVQVDGVVFEVGDRVMFEGEEWTISHLLFKECKDWQPANGSYVQLRGWRSTRYVLNNFSGRLDNLSGRLYMPSSKQIRAALSDWARSAVNV